jgi:hypothetical protein
VGCRQIIFRRDKVGLMKFDADQLASNALHEGNLAAGIPAHAAHAKKAGANTGPELPPALAA